MVTEPHDDDLVEKYRKIQSLAARAEGAEAEAAATRLAELEAKYPGIDRQAAAKTEWERRQEEAANRRRATRMDPNASFREKINSWFPQEGEPAPDIPSAVEFVDQIDFPDNFIGRKLKQLAAGWAEKKDKQLEELKEQWDAVEYDDLQRFLSERIEALSDKHNSDSDEDEPFEADLNTLREEYYKVAKLKDLLMDPDVCDIEVDLGVDDDNGEDLVIFELTLPVPVWEKSRKDPKTFVKVLQEEIEAIPPLEDEEDEEDEEAEDEDSATDE